MKTDWLWLRYVFAVGLLIGTFLMVLLLASGLVHASELVNYTVYVNQTSGAGYLTLNISNLSLELLARSDPEQEVEQQMGATAVALLAAAFIYAAVALPQRQISIKMGSWMIGVLLGLNAVLMASVNMAEARASIVLMVWVIRATVLVAFLYLTFRMLQQLAGEMPRDPTRQY